MTSSRSARSGATRRSAPRRPPVVRPAGLVTARPARCAGRQAHNRCTGEWIPNFHLGRNMPADARRYQEQITGCSAALDYHLSCGSSYADFDGYCHGSLLEAKFYPANGLFIHALAAYRGEPSRMERSTAVPYIRRLLGQAREQHVLARAAGLVLKWHVSSAEARAGLSDLFTREGIGGITLLHTPPGRRRICR